jgi:phosphohistidine phosphatase
MRTLLLIRHAKSSWNDAGISDFDRPLNERGKKDAPVMAQRLIHINIKIDLLVSSPAKRAKATAKIFAAEFKKSEHEILYLPSLYHADPTTFTKLIAGIDDQFIHIALFSHNPGITSFANMISEVRVDDMPTCAVFGVKLEAASWKEFDSSEKKFLIFDYPKSEAAH